MMNIVLQGLDKLFQPLFFAIEEEKQINIRAIQHSQSPIMYENVFFNQYFFEILQYILKKFLIMYISQTKNIFIFTGNHRSDIHLFDRTCEKQETSSSCDSRSMGNAFHLSCRYSRSGFDFNIYYLHFFSLLLQFSEIIDISIPVCVNFGSLSK